MPILDFRPGALCTSEASPWSALSSGGPTTRMPACLLVMKISLLRMAFVYIVMPQEG
jgi:hypothetical protein